MKSTPLNMKRFTTFVKDNYILAIFISIIILVGFIILFKLFTSKDETVYARVKVSQGLWWASTVKPSVWMLPAFQKGDKEVSLTGKPIVEILEVRHYPASVYSTSEQYDIILLVKLNISLNKKTGKYAFKRSAIAVGSPIDFEFPKAQVSGTIMDMSDRPIKDKTVEKNLTIRKNFASPWEYDGIFIGDTYFDGESTVIKVIDKSFENAYEDYSTFGNGYPVYTEKPVNIEVDLKIQLTEKDNSLIYKNEIPMQLGRQINLQTDHFFFDQYTITKISN